MRMLNKFLATVTVWKSAPDYPAKDLKLEKNDDGGWVIYISKELQKLVYYERCATLRSSRQRVADKRYNSKVHGTILVLHYTPPELQGKRNQLTIYKIYKINWRRHPQGTLNDFKSCKNVARSFGRRPGSLPNARRHLDPTAWSQCTLR